MLGRLGGQALTTMHCGREGGRKGEGGGNISMKLTSDLNSDCGNQDDTASPPPPSLLQPAPTPTACIHWSKTCRAWNYRGNTAKRANIIIKGTSHQTAIWFMNETIVYVDLLWRRVFKKRPLLCCHILILQRLAGCRTTPVGGLRCTHFAFITVGRENSLSNDISCKAPLATVMEASIAQFKT